MNREKKVRALEALLADHGYNPVPLSGDDIQQSGSTSRALLAVLEPMPFMAVYDLEGNFCENGAHSEIIEDLLSRADIMLDGCSDEWVYLSDRSSEHFNNGYLLRIKYQGQERYFFSVADPDSDSPYASDWEDGYLMQDVVNEVLKGTEYRYLYLFDPANLDQTVASAIIKQGLLTELETSELFRVTQNEDDIYRSEETEHIYIVPTEYRKDNCGTTKIHALELLKKSKEFEPQFFE
jgi:hypothetical protein